jgi:5-methylcytosine-specific restriction endonuclease McrA
MKICKTCHIEKEVEGFALSRGSADGYRNSCKACENEKQKARYDADPEKYKKRTKAWQESNRDRVRENNLRYYADWTEGDREANIARAAAWAKEHPEESKEHSRRTAARRRARIREQGFEYYSEGDVYERDGWTCALCKQAVDKSLQWPDPMSKSIDHITPISLGGTDTLDNVQTSHLSCNWRKGANRGYFDKLMEANPEIYIA